MKRRLYIAFLFMVILAACNSNKQVPEPVEGPSPALSAIDSLMWVQPDSALAMIVDYWNCRDVSGNVSTFDRHYAHLLLAELLYKNYYDQTNRAELLEAVGYFDSLTLNLNNHPHAFWRHCGRLVSLSNHDPQSPDRDGNLFFLDARAHYINGVGYYEHDSVVPACKEYLKALEVMEEHFEEKELVGKKAKFMALSYTHLSGLFSDMYLHEQAIYYGKWALHYYNKYEASPMHIAWALDEIGLHYDILDNYDSAYFHYNQGLKVLSDINSLTYRDIVTHLACLSYKEGGDATKSLSQLCVLINNAESDIEYYSRCLSIGEIYYTEKQFDSAWNYFDKVYNGTQSVESKKLAAERLIEICKVQGKKIETSEYVDFLIPFANQEEIKSAVKSQLTELYKSFNQRKLEQLHRHEKKKNLKWIIGISIGFLAVLSIVAVFYHKNKRKRQLLEIQIKEEQLTHTIQQKSLSGRLKQKNQEMRKLQDQIKQQNDKDAETEPIISFVEEPVCRLIMERVKEGQFKSQMDCTIYKSYALTKDQIMDLNKAVNLHFDGFAVRLKKAYPQLTDSDINYCSLYLLGLNDADIAALMQKAYPTVSQRSRKLKTIFGSDTSLPITLHNFANNNLSY